MKSFLSLLILNFAFLTASIVQAAPSCRSLFRDALVGYVVDGEPGQVHYINHQTKYSENREVRVGRLDYDYTDETQTLMIEWIHVQAKMRDQGVANYMFQEVLSRFPETTQVIGYLTDSNLLVYEAALEAFKDPVLALKATPYFHSLANLGFSEILANEYFDGKVTVALKKPDSVH